MNEVSGQDHFTALPPEILHEIISYLFPTHNPDKYFSAGLKRERDKQEDIRRRAAEELDARYANEHTLDYLAATCKVLQSAVMDFAQTFLRQHKDITNFKERAAQPKSNKPQTRWLRDRGGLLYWTDRNCVFCGKATRCFAVLMNGFHCCKKCDEVQWPNKINKSTAREEFDLTDHHLLPEVQESPVPAKKLASHPSGLPTLRYGTCVLSGCPATYFLRKDVEALAKLVHGDVEAHMVQRRAERAERSRKIMATRQRKELEARRARQAPQG